MPEDELEKRIRTLEIRSATLLGSIVTLAVCCLAFLGFEYYRIPHQVQKQLEDKIGKDTVQQLEEAKQNAKLLEEQIMRIGSRRVRTKLYEHGQVVPLPNGTKQEDWVAFIAPMDMGLEEPGSEGDNSLLVFESSLTENEGGGWKVNARYKFRFASAINIPKELCDWHASRANVLLIPR